MKQQIYLKLINSMRGNSVDPEDDDLGYDDHSTIGVSGKRKEPIQKFFKLQKTY